MLGTPGDEGPAGLKQLLLVRLRGWLMVAGLEVGGFELKKEAGRVGLWEPEPRPASVCSDLRRPFRIPPTFWAEKLVGEEGGRGRIWVRIGVEGLRLGRGRVWLMGQVWSCWLI